MKFPSTTKREFGGIFPISQSMELSFPRMRESMKLAIWIPAYAGMTRIIVSFDKPSPPLYGLKIYGKFSKVIKSCVVVYYS
jgi:hypothetical protein